MWWEYVRCMRIRWKDFDSWDREIETSAYINKQTKYESEEDLNSGSLYPHASILQSRTWAL